MAHTSEQSQREAAVADLSEARIGLLDRYAARREEFVRRGLERVRELVGELTPEGDVEAERMLVEQLEGNFDNAVLRVRMNIERTQPGGGPLAIQAVAGAQYSARAGMSLAALARAYRIAHSISWDILAEEIARLEIPSEQRAAISRLASRMQFDYNDELLELVTREYTDEAERLARGREQRRVAALTRVLEGEDDGAAPALEYDLDGWHVGAIVQGRDPESVARTLARGWRREALTVARSDDVVWAWIGTQREPDRADLDELASVTLKDGMSISLGEPASGPDGFRLTHAQARAAQRVALSRGGRVTRYGDVAIVAAALADRVARDSLVPHYLGELAGNDERHNALRETLAAYFATGQNAASAAARLGVHEKTVANRLRTIEDMLGPIPPQRVELEVALRLRALTADNKPEPGESR